MAEPYWTDLENIPRFVIDRKELETLESNMNDAKLAKLGVDPYELPSLGSSEEKSYSLSQETPEGVKRETYLTMEMVQTEHVLVFQKGDHWVDWAFLCLSSEDDNGKHYSVVVRGGGTPGLRENRHMWFGEDGNGYLFYANLEGLRWLTGRLSKWFD